MLWPDDRCEVKDASDPVIVINGFKNQGCAHDSIVFPGGAEQLSVLANDAPAGLRHGARHAAAMRIALAQINPTIADIEGNLEKIRDCTERAAAGGARLVVFSELAAIGYLPLDLLERRHLIETQWRRLQELAANLPIPALVGCVEPLSDGPSPRVANALAVLRNGRIECTYHKQLLPNYDVFDERRYFRPGRESRVIEIEGMRFGLSICEDIWTEEFSGWSYAHDPLAALRGQCDVLVSLSASPYSAIKPHNRERLVRSVAASFQAPVVYVNQIAGQDELLFDGGSCVIGPDGAYYAQAKRWQEDLCFADLDQPIAEPEPFDELADLYQGLCLGIQDYCRKCHQRSVVLGLSGGIDSALVATMAVDALGAEQVHGLLMPGPYSSQHSIDDALALAKNLGISSDICSITEAYNAVDHTLREAFSGTEANVAEENMQARLRGTLVMAYANKYNAMALTTGNKSEVAVGYCTIYGDMNGGLAPIADVYKTRVWELSRYANRESERIPVNSIEKAPSAELRPDQLDSDSLPPYEDLDDMIYAYVELQESPEQIIARGYDAETVHFICRLIEINEYKRRQYAPVLRVTDKAFGIGRRIPLARCF